MSQGVDAEGHCQSTESNIQREMFVLPHCKLLCTSVYSGLFLSTLFSRFVKKIEERAKSTSA